MTEKQLIKKIADEVIARLNLKVDKSTTVNNYQLDSDITLDKTDIGLSNVVNKVMDSTPTENSDNYVTSGGVYSALGDKQPTISDLETIRSGASAGATAVQDNSYVHTDNNFTNTDKGNISKALYFKGAFDSADGKTRQTGYANKENYKLAYDSTNHVAKLIGVAGAHNDYPSSVLNIDGYTQQNVWDITQLNNMSYTIFNADGESRILFKNTSFTEASAYEFLNKIEVQFQLKSSYTENIIENQSILPLDTNMANKIRQKVVDGLQLWDEQWESGQLETDTTSANFGLKVVNNSTIRAKNFISVKPNTNYFSSYASTVIFFYDINQQPIIYGSGGYTVGGVFTTPSNAYYVRFYLVAAYGTTYKYDIMLVEGNHPYPYSSFNQKEHITNEQAELLKSEEEKCRNLFNKDDSSMVYGTSYDVNDPGVTTSDWRSLFWIDVSKFQGKIIYTGYAVGINRYAFYDSVNGNRISMATDYNRNYIEVPSNATRLNICNWVSTSETRTSYQYFGDNLIITLNGYQLYEPYCGEIVHQKDISELISKTSNLDSDGKLSANSLKNFYKLSNMSSITYFGSWDRFNTTAYCGWENMRTFNSGYHICFLKVHYDSNQVAPGYTGVVIFSISGNVAAGTYNQGYDIIWATSNISINNPLGNDNPLPLAVKFTYNGNGTATMVVQQRTYSSTVKIDSMDISFPLTYNTY